MADSTSTKILDWIILRGTDFRLHVALVLLLLIGFSHLHQAVARPPLYLPQDVLWREVVRESAARNLDPGFVYAIIFAESSFNAHAHNQRARGLMQLTPPAWEEVTTRPFYQAWNWRVNLRAGMDYLVYCRNFLEANQSFSYPNLAAAYRYGPFHLQREGFSLARMPRPTNRVYQEIFRGNIHPVAWPGRVQGPI